MKDRDPEPGIIVLLAVISLTLCIMIIGIDAFMHALWGPMQ